MAHANVKAQNIFHGLNNIHVAQILNEELQPYIYPRNTVCLRYIMVNTLHKGDNKDDDDDDDNNNNNK